MNNVEPEMGCRVESERSEYQRSSQANLNGDISRLAKARQSVGSIP